MYFTSHNLKIKKIWKKLTISLTLAGMKMKQHVNLPVMKFFEAAASENSQDAPVLE